MAIAPVSASVFSLTANDFDINIGTGLQIVADTLMLGTNLDLSTNGSTTVGDFRGTVEAFSATGTVHNQALGSNTTVLRWTGTSQIELTGLTGGVEGREVEIINDSSLSVYILIYPENVGSTAANRFAVGPVTRTWLRNGNAARFRYIDSRWHHVGIATSTYDNFSALTLSGTNFSANTATVGQFKGTTQTDAGTGSLNDFALTSTTTVLRFTGSPTPTLFGMTGGVGMD